MDAMKVGWFSEANEIWPGLRLSLEVKEVLHKEKTKYQELMILDTKSCGKALILDNIIQCTEFDEFSYQEMISFLPLYSHPCPRKVLIVGGGDGGVAREVSKHETVEQVYQVEIDDRVIDLCKQYLPSMAVGLSHPKVKLCVEDGFQFMRKHQGEFDVIITDSSDPLGPAVPLFEKEYFQLMKSALKPGGIVCSQVGSPWANMDTVCKTYKLCSELFHSVSVGYACVPTYPSGQIGFVIAGLNKDSDFSNPLVNLTDKDLDEMDLKYYSSNIHRAAFVLPKFLKNTIEKSLQQQ